jgi:hypothetical protein
MYPGSEPETEAVLRFFHEHPNIGIVLSLESGEGYLSRPFDHLPDKQVPELDQKIYQRFAKQYKKQTGFGFASSKLKKKAKGESDEGQRLRKELEAALPKEIDIDAIFEKGSVSELSKSPEGQGIIQQYRISTETIKKLTRLQQMEEKQKKSTTERSDKGPMDYGSFLDWIYKDFNAYALRAGVSALPKEYRTPSESDSVKNMKNINEKWVDFFKKETNGKGFVDWQPYEHPQLGKIEIGGWVHFYKKNPPVGPYLTSLAVDHARFVLDLADMTSTIRIQDIQIKPLQILQKPREIKVTENNSMVSLSPGKAWKEGGAVLAEIEVKIENMGGVGTRNALAQKTRYARQPNRSVLVSLEAMDGKIDILSMPKVLRLGAIEGSETTAFVKQTLLEERLKSRKEGKKKKEEEEPIIPHVKKGSWLVLFKGSSAELMVKAVSEQGGSVTKRFTVHW